MQNVHQVIHKWPFTAFTILHAECSSDAYKTDEHSTWRMFIRCTLTCAILQMLSHLKSGKQRNGYRSIHTSVKSLKSWNSNAFIFSAQKSRQNLNELNCVRILARTAKLNAASNSRKTIDVIVFRVLPVYYLLNVNQENTTYWIRYPRRSRVLVGVMSWRETRSRLTSAWTTWLTTGRRKEGTFIFWKLADRKYHL